MTALPDSFPPKTSFADCEGKLAVSLGGRGVWKSWPHGEGLSPVFVNDTARFISEDEFRRLAVQATVTSSLDG